MWPSGSWWRPIKNTIPEDNLAALGIDVLTETAILDGLPADEKGAIIDAVRFHNAPTLPLNRPPVCMVFLRLIGDADKLEIWKVIADCYRHR